jgi:hypothetical protein
VVGLIVVLFLGLVTFVFWLANLGEKKEKAKTKDYNYDETAADYENTH